MKKISIKYFVLSIMYVFLYTLPVHAQADLDLVNQKVCTRFEGDVNKLAAIMEEHKSRLGITETRVAFGGSDTPIKAADYWINYAAEAIAFQRAQKYSSKNQVKTGLETLKGKILRAKAEVKKALNSDE